MDHLKHMTDSDRDRAIINTPNDINGLSNTIHIALCFLKWNFFFFVVDFFFKWSSDILCISFFNLRIPFTVS